MKNGKRLLSLFTAAAMAMSTFVGLAMPASAAETATATVTMTQVSGSDADVDKAFGTLEQIQVGYNKISDNNVGLANKGWGVNYIGYLKVDASNINGTITGATLTADISGSTDSKRKAGVGVGYNETTVDESLTYNKANKTITPLGDQQWTTTTTSSIFENKSWDITDALKTDEDKIATIVVYETAAAGCYFKNPVVTVTYLDANAVVYDVTVNFVTEDMQAIEGKDSITEKVESGASFTPEYDTVFNANGNKYTYKKGADTVEINENKTINVVYSSRVLKDTKVTAIAKSGETEIGSYETALREDTSSKATYPKYIVKDGKLYNVPQEKSEKKFYFGKNVTGKEEDQTFDVEYTEDTERTPVYFGEMENVLTNNKAANAEIRCSGGAGGDISADETDGKAIINLGAGTYKIEVAVWGGNSDTAEDAQNSTYTVTAGENVVTAKNTGSIAILSSDEFTLTEATDVVVKKTIAGTSSNVCVDYVLITGTGTATEVVPATKYNVTVAENIENGTVTVDKAQAAEGSEVTVTATPGEGYILDTIRVTVGDSDVTVTDGKFTMPADDVTVSATFKAPAKNAVTVTEAANGTVTVDNTTDVAEGTKVTITATPDEGYEVDTIAVMAGETAVTVAEDNTFVMPAEAVTVTVTFKAKAVAPTTYKVNVADTVPEEGSVAVDKTEAAKDEVVTITATAADGYEVDAITVKAGDTDVAVADGKFTMPESDVTVTVTFKAKEPVDYSKIIDFTDRTLTYESKGSSTVFDVTDATTAGATALAAANAGNVLKLGSSQNGGGKMLGYKADFAKEGANTVVYGGKTTMSFKFEPMQVRTDKDASIELSFADINGNKILPMVLGTGSSAYVKAGGSEATGIAYGSYYIATYTMDFAAKTATLKITTADGATTCLEVTDSALAAENITQLYRPDADWSYGYVAIDDIKLDAEEVGVPVFYSITINTERYAKLTTSTNLVYYADVNGKIEIPLQKPNTTFDYTLSKVGYTDVTGTVAPLTADFTDEKAMTKTDDKVLYIESEFGNANEAYVSIAGSRNDTISLGSVALADVSEITVDFDFASLGTENGSQKTWYMVTDGGELVGIQMNLDGMFAWTDWTGNANHNQSSDVGAFTNGVRIGDVPSGAFTVKFVVDKVNKAITVSYNNTTNGLSYTIDANTLTGLGTGLYRAYGELKTTEIKVAEPDPMFMQLAGDTQFGKIQGKTVTRQFNRIESMITPDETFTWTLSRADEKAMDGITVDENGLVSVTDAAIPGTVTLTAEGTSGKKASIDIKVEDFSQVIFTADGPQSYDIKDTTGKYFVTSAKDTYGDTIMDLMPAPVWTSSNSEVLTIDPATGVATVVGQGTATITATVTNGTEVSAVSINATVAVYSITQDVTGNETVIDVSGMVKDPAITGYMVTTSKDGVLVSQKEVAIPSAGAGTAAEDAEKIVAKIVDGKLAITTEKVAKGAAVDMTAEDGVVFLWNSLNGMQPVSLVTAAPSITVDTTGADKVEVAPIYNTAINTLLLVPSDRYNITATANNGRRTDLYVNDQMLINNINQGSDNWTVGRIIAESSEYEANDVVIGEGYAKFNLRDDQSSGTTVTNVKFVKAPSIVKRATRVYVIGDSLVAKYYGDAPEGQESLVRTGWGDVLQTYIKDANVTNLGNSGAWATGMYGDAFTNVQKSAQKGDIVIWESGYNDRNHGGAEPMKEAMTKVAEECAELDVTLFFVTPNTSSHDYKADVVLAADVRAVAEETNTKLIDLSQKSYDFLNGMYAELDDVHKQLQTYYNNTGDTLHSSFNAANCWAAIVASGLLADDATKDYVNTEASYTFNDGIKDITVKAE